MNNFDWNISGCVPRTDSDDDIQCITDMAMLRCHRLSSMTESHNDPDITERILQENEKDLELAARIGKALLQRNEELQRQNEILEERMGYANDQVTQLKHELHRKSELLRVFTDDENGEASCSDFKITQERRSSGNLHCRIRVLEGENCTLKSEINKLKALTVMLKEKEDHMVGEFLRKIAETKRQAKAVETDLQEKQQECEAKADKIRSLNKKLVDKTKHAETLKEENETLAARLLIVQGLQANLAQELSDLQERYAEVLSMLASAKDELNEAQTIIPDPSRCSEWSAREADSLASELELSDSGYSTNCTGTYSKPVRNQHAGSQDKAPSAIMKVHPPKDEPTEAIESSKTLEYDKFNKEKQLELEFQDDGRIEDIFTTTATLDPIESDLGAIEKAKGIMRNIEAALEMPFTTGPLSCQYNTRLGVPGTPGSKDLQLAIERLAHRRRQTAGPSDDPPADGGVDDHTPKPHRNQPGPTRSKTPPGRSKVMITVPVEGSKSLAHWRELATPSGIDPRSWRKMPGINVRNGFGASSTTTLPNVSSSWKPSSPVFPSSAAQVASSQAAPTNAHSSADSKDGAGLQKPASLFGRLSLTEKCAALFNSVNGSWLATAQGSSEGSRRNKTEAAPLPMPSQLGNQDRGLCASLCDLQMIEPADFSNGVVTRAGLNNF